MPRGAENPEGRLTGKEPQMEEEKLLRRGESNKAQPIIAKVAEPFSFREYLGLLLPDWDKNIKDE